MQKFKIYDTDLILFAHIVYAYIVTLIYTTFFSNGEHKVSRVQKLTPLLLVRVRQNQNQYIDFCELHVISLPANEAIQCLNLIPTCPWLS